MIHTVCAHSLQRKNDQNLLSERGAPVSALRPGIGVIALQQEIKTRQPRHNLHLMSQRSRLYMRYLTVVLKLTHGVEMARPYYTECHGTQLLMGLQLDIP